MYSAGEAGDLAVEAEVAHASGLGWLPDGTLVVSTLFDTKVHHVDAAGNVTATYDHSELVDSTNDLLVAPDGRAYVDLYQASGEAQSDFIDAERRDADRRIRARDAERPWLLAARIDSRRQRDSAGRGSSRSRPNPTATSVLQAFSPISDAHRHPDGLCVDVEGGVWVGCVDTGEFLRVRRGWRRNSPRRDRPRLGESRPHSAAPTDARYT